MLARILTIVLTLTLLAPATASACETTTTYYLTEPEYIGKALIPTDANPETTPTVLVDGYWIPEESPIGTAPTTAWLDNSPVYGGGWYLQVNDSHTPPTIAWREMTSKQWDLTLVYPSGK